MTDFISQTKKGHLDNKELLKWMKENRIGTGAASVTVPQKTGYEVMVCPLCATIFFSATLIPTYFGQNYVCDTCLKKNFTFCDSCNTYVLTQDLKSLTHVHVVPAAAPKKKKTIEVNGELVVVEDDTIDQVEFPHNKVEPWNADVMRSRIIHRTALEEMVIRKRLQAGDKSDPWRYFGIELEVEKIKGAPPDLVSRVVNLLGTDFVLIKHDGSLSEGGKGGFEIVSTPASLGFHKQAWNNFFDQLSQFFLPNPTTTGMHVHVSKNNISQMDLGKLMYFINAKDNIKFICDIAGRDLTKPNPNGKFYAALKNRKPGQILTLKVHLEDCPWHPHNKNLSNRYLLTKHGGIAFDPYGNPIIATLVSAPQTVRPICRCPDGRYQGVDRYEALNISTKRATIEFRIFRGEVDKGRFMSNLEFCDAAINFCKESTLRELNGAGFCTWIKGHYSQYRNLGNFLAGRGYIEYPKNMKSRPDPVPQEQPQLNLQGGTDAEDNLEPGFTEPDAWHEAEVDHFLWDWTTDPNNF